MLSECMNLFNETISTYIVLILRSACNLRFAAILSITVSTTSSKTFRFERHWTHKITKVRAIVIRNKILTNCVT